MFRRQRIRDSLHNLIEFDASEFEHVLWRVIQTRPFQRLRRIKQLGFSELVYPGATHTRFAHSVGVFHTARQLMAIIERHLGKRDRYRESRAHTAIAAALVHDLGHGPFSHAFEEVGKKLNLKMARHEPVSDLLIRDGEVADELKVLGSGFANDVADVIKRKGADDLYDAVVSSQFDADRLDYMRRDRLMTGTQSAAIDFDWLMANLEIGTVQQAVDGEKAGELPTFVLGPKASHAAETYVLALFQLYPTVYFHKATRGMEKVFSVLLARLIALIGDDSRAATGLPENHPLVLFAKDTSSLASLLRLDDTVIWGCLSMLAEAEDKPLAALAKRMRDRRLMKCVDIRETIARSIAPAVHATKQDREKIEEDIDKRVTTVLDKIGAWSSDDKAATPRILTDKAVRAPYRRSNESKGPLNQIVIRLTNDKIVDIAEHSPIVAAVDDFRLDRAYVDKDDCDAMTLIEQSIEEACDP